MHAFKQTQKGKMDRPFCLQFYDKIIINFTHNTQHSHAQMYNKLTITPTTTTKSTMTIATFSFANNQPRFSELPQLFVRVHHNTLQCTVIVWYSG